MMPEEEKPTCPSCGTDSNGLCSDCKKSTDDLIADVKKDKNYGKGKKN